MGLKNPRPLGHTGSNPVSGTKIYARVAELADAPASNSGSVRSGGSSPLMGTRLW